MQKRRLKLVALFTISLFIAGLIGYGAAQTAPTTYTISSGVYPSATDYTVWTNSTHNFLKNAYGYQPIAASTNATYILQYALTNGDSVKVLAGTYSLLYLTTKSNNHLYTEENAVLVATQLTTNYPMIWVEGDSVEINGFTMNAQNANTTALGVVYIWSGSNCKIHDNNVIVGNAIAGLRTTIYTSNSRFYANNLTDGVLQGFNIAGNYNTVENNYIENMTSRAIVIGDGYYTNVIDNTVNQADSIGEGIQVAYANYGTLIDGNHVLNCNTGRSICIYAKTGSARSWTTISETTIVNNYINCTAGSGAFLFSTNVGYSIYYTIVSNNQVQAYGANVVEVAPADGTFQLLHFIGNMGLGYFNSTTQVDPYFGNDYYAYNTGFTNPP